MELKPREKAKKIIKLHKGYLPSSIRPELAKALSKHLSLLWVHEILLNLGKLPSIKENEELYNYFVKVEEEVQAF